VEQGKTSGRSSPTCRESGSIEQGRRNTFVFLSSNRDPSTYNCEEFESSWYSQRWILAKHRHGPDRDFATASASLKSGYAKFADLAAARRGAALCLSPLDRVPRGGLRECFAVVSTSSCTAFGPSDPAVAATKQSRRRPVRDSEAHAERERYQDTVHAERRPSHL